MAERLLIIACGALAREINQLRDLHEWKHVDLKCIDASLHNRPEKIPDELRKRIRKYRDDYQHIYVAYADCGTGGYIDRVIEEEGIERLPGAHCYQFFAGSDAFEKLATEEPGSFYLTDFLVNNFKRLVVVPLKLEEHPELRDMYFGNYQRVVYLAQTEDHELQSLAQQAADYLGLEYQYLYCGYGELESGIGEAVLKRDLHEKNTRFLA